MRRVTLLAVALAIVPQIADAACINKFVQHREASGRWVITLLTGYLTFQDAQQLARDIQAKKSPLLEWVDDKGKMIARQISELRVMRPMPVACGDKQSGVIMVTTFLSARPPEGKMRVKIDEKTVVDFEEQKE